MRRVYEKPVIYKLKTGYLNKFGKFAFPYMNRIRKDIEGVSVESLVETFGSPLFVFSERKIRKKFREIRDAFTLRYPNVEFSWSYKTNYLDAICAILHSEGETAEVVSEFEYEKARRLGVPGSQIVFNGPYKPYTALIRAVEEGARINVDHFEELSDLEKVADELNVKVKVGIRINLDCGVYPRWDRFGFNLESGQAWNAVKRILSSGKLELIGLHCHIGTFILEPRAYEIAIRKLVKFMYRIESETPFKIDYIDIGGGFPSRNRLKGVYLPPEVAVPSIDEYAEKICSALLTELKPGDYPKLIVESGRAIVDEAGFLITSVHASKRLPDGRKAYILDAGVNILFTAFWYHFNVEIDGEVHGPAESCVLYGPLCMNIDVVDEGVMLPPLHRGTRLVLSPVGAYNVTQWMQFIRYRPAVVLIGEDGKVELIREREDISDIVGRERLPERLKPKWD